VLNNCRRRPLGATGTVAIGLCLLGQLCTASCTSVARLDNVTDPTCRTNLSAGVASILTAEGESPNVADNLANATSSAIVGLGPRPFLVSSSSGTDYSFFVQRKQSKCLLRLYGRQKGFMQYTNNLTYIATRELAGCACSE
jgi:hypothetical protein